MRYAFLLCLLSFILVAQAQNVTYESADSVLIEQLLQHATPSTTVLHFARSFMGRPYVAHTLEVNEQEQLVVNTRQLDCTTLVETATALYLCARQGKTSFADYCNMLLQLRYRQGKRKGYTSRLHYFSDWIADKQLMHLVSEVQQPRPPFTAVQEIRVSYMSQHPAAYKALKGHLQLVSEIARQEKALTGTKARYIPKAQVSDSKVLRRAVKDGDIIAITCSKPGLDIAHLGFAVWQKDGLHLLNASQLHKKVVLEPMTLSQYLAKHPSHTGIRVVRIEQ